LIHHRHRGGNCPHVHHHDAADEQHQHHHQNRDEVHRSDSHGDHAYDSYGNEAAIVASDSHRLEHWHFDRRFESIAIAPICDFDNDFPLSFAAIVNHDLNLLPLAARPPPLLA
jgi:hypothetical protein